MNNPDIKLDGALGKLRGFAKDICEIHGAAEAYDIIEIIDAIEAAIPEGLNDALDAVFAEYGTDCPLTRGKFIRAVHVINQIKTKGDDCEQK